MSMKMEMLSIKPSASLWKFMGPMRLPRFQMEGSFFRFQAPNHTVLPYSRYLVLDFQHSHKPKKKPLYLSISSMPIRPADKLYNAKLSIGFTRQLGGRLYLFSLAPNGS